MKEVTISDIAKKAGVAKSTVSRVINEKGYVKEATRVKIEKIMQELSYTPSATARSLSMQKSSVVGVVFPEMDNPFFAKIIQSINVVLSQNELTVMLYFTANKVEEDIKALNTIRCQRVCGLIYTPAIEYENEDKKDTIMQILSGIGTPVVLLDRTIPGTSYDGVYSNNFEGAYSATRALIAAGHTKIGIVLGDMTLSIGRDRYLGFKKALEDNGVKFRNKYAIHGEFNTEITYQETKKFLTGNDLPTAFFVSNNLSSKGFLKAVFENGLKIPEDLAYIGFDPVDGIEIFGLEYSCLDRNVEHMGTEAARLLMKRMANVYGKTEQIPLTPVLRLRGSEKFIKK